MQRPVNIPTGKLNHFVSKTKSIIHKFTARMFEGRAWLAVMQYGDTFPSYLQSCSDSVTMRQPRHPPHNVSGT